MQGMAQGSPCCEGRYWDRGQDLNEVFDYRFDQERDVGTPCPGLRKYTRQSIWGPRGIVLAIYSETVQKKNTYQ